MRIFCEEVILSLTSLGRHLLTALFGAYDGFSDMTGMLEDRHVVSELLRYRGLLTALGLVIFEVEYA